MKINVYYGLPFVEVELQIRDSTVAHSPTGKRGTEIFP
ncbi:Uncharacterised protein [Paenibacillus macerans]|nr:Uncharacterised protein [Paenibacillus macerans]